MKLNKKDYKNFIYSPSRGLSVWAGSTIEEIYLLSDDVFLTNFLPLTPESEKVLEMLYLGINMEEIKIALSVWEKFELDCRGSAGYYYYSIVQGNWV